MCKKRKNQLLFYKRGKKFLLNEKRKQTSALRSGATDQGHWQNKKMNGQR